MFDCTIARGVIGLGGDRVLLGSGPFVRVAKPPPARIAFYAPDFFLADPAPWWIPATSQVLSREALRQTWAAAPSLERLPWVEPDRKRFAQAFAQLQGLIEAGELDKAVPVVFAIAQSKAGFTERLPALLARILVGPEILYPYGLWNEAGGLLGVTPETLFSASAAGGVQTMALAGTASPAAAPTLLDDPKERLEHDLVIKDLLVALAPFGEVTQGRTRLMDLGSMVHILTDINLVGGAGFSELVTALHPTPALGVAPRSAGLGWLREQDRGVDRGRFGAPFGVRLADGSGHCLVAIRNVMWRGGEVLIGSGCGVVAASVEEREWQELAAKRQVVKDTFGL